MRKTIIVFVVSLCILVRAAAAEVLVSASVERHKQDTWGNYAGHIDHPRIGWLATIQTGATAFVFRHWVDADKSHAPKVLPLEGMIGLVSPATQNWYCNGFMQLYVNGEMVGETPVKSVRVTEEGARGAVVFDWEREEGAWRVTFLAFPNGKSLFCSVKYFPSTKPGNWEIRLVNYPAGATTDGEREIATARQTVKQKNNVKIATADEWWVAYYDNVHEFGTPGSEGPSALVYVPEDVATCEVGVGSYAVGTTIQPKGNEVRMIFWDSFFGMKNAEAVDYMKSTANAQLQTLRQTRFVNYAVFSEAWKKDQSEIETLLAKLNNPVKESGEAAELKGKLAEISTRLMKKANEETLDDEQKFTQALETQKKLLWYLQEKQLFSNE